MTGLWAGLLLGACAGIGLLLVLDGVLALRRRPLADRVDPWLREPSGNAVGLRPRSSSTAASRALMQRAAQAIETTFGGAASVRRRLERSASPLDVQGFRIEQVQWGLAGLGVVSLWQTLTLVSGRGNLVSGLLLCAGGFLLGVILRDRRLTARADARDREVVAEFPVIAELLALSVASGEGPVAALDRVVRRSHGALAQDLAAVLALVRTGTPVARAFEEMARRSAVPVVAQFAQGVAVSVDRGTPLADVLHAQAADVREAGRRTLIEVAARREIYMLAPVVFLVLPVTVLFAFYPGLVGLRITAP